MQPFRTIFNIKESDVKINYHSRSIFIGSCFTENIGNYLKDMRFQTICNPTGIIYNPYSINECIKYLLNKKQFNEDSLEYYNDVWFSFYHHGKFSNTDKNICLAQINSELKEASEFIKQTDFLFLTFGSAFIYTHKNSNEIVANCHKFPANTFSKSLMKPNIIAEEYEKTLNQLIKTNSKIKIIFTISPIRHWKDGAVENQLSKSILFVSINEILRNFSNCFYFPAYELMMDDLRDYRFYAEDMIHPNSMALEYIREIFSDIYIDKNVRNIMSEIHKFIQAKNHRPFNPNSASHKKFKETHLNHVLKLQIDFPFLDLKEFEEYFKEGI